MWQALPQSLQADADLPGGPILSMTVATQVPIRWAIMKAATSAEGARMPVSMG